MKKEGHSVSSDLFETSIFPLWSHDIHRHIQAHFKAVLRSGCTSSLWNILLCKYFSIIPHEPFTPIHIFSRKETEREISWRNIFLSLNNPMRFYIMGIYNHAFGDPESIQLFHLLLELCPSPNSSLLIFVRISELDNSSFIWFSLDNRACVSLCKASFTKSASRLFPRGKEQYNTFYNN